MDDGYENVGGPSNQEDKNQNSINHYEEEWIPIWTRPSYIRLRGDPNKTIRNQN